MTVETSYAIITLIGVWHIFIGMIMNTENVRSSFIFKFMPIITGAFLFILGLNGLMH